MCLWSLIITSCKSYFIKKIKEKLIHTKRCPQPLNLVHVKTLFLWINKWLRLLIAGEGL